MSRSRKAQTPIFENVMLFAVSIIIFIVFVSIFSVYQSHFLSETVVYQLDELNSFITSAVIELALSEGTDSSVTITIPKLVGAQRYEVRALNEGINITTLTTGQSSFSSLFNMTTTNLINVSGERILSRRGRIIINKQGNNIILG
jgi:hypothetical protein